MIKIFWKMMLADWMFVMLTPAFAAEGLKDIQAPVEYPINYLWLVSIGLVVVFCMYLGFIVFKIFFPSKIKMSQHI